MPDHFDPPFDLERLRTRILGAVGRLVESSPSDTRRQPRRSGPEWLPTAGEVEEARQRVTSLLPLAQAERRARLETDPAAVSPALVEALLEEARSRLAPLAESTSETMRIVSVSEALSFASLAEQQARRLRPDLYVSALVFDLRAGSELLAALALTAGARWAEAERAFQGAGKLAELGTGDPLLWAELDLVEALLARARGELSAARLALRLAAERYEDCGERACARIVWSLLLEVSSAMGTADPPPPSPPSAIPPLAHVLGVWRSGRVRGVVAEGEGAP